MFVFNIEKIESKDVTNSGTFLQLPFWLDFKSRHGWKNLNFSVKVQYPEEDSEDEGNCHNKNKPAPEKMYESFQVSVLVRNFAKGKLSIAYVPLMPGLPYKCTEKSIVDQALDFEDREFDSDEELRKAREVVIYEELVTPETQAIEFANFLNDFGLALKPFLPGNCIAIRFDPDVVFYEPEERDSFNHGVKFISFADKLHVKKNKVDIQPPDSTLVDLTVSEDDILARMHSKWRYNIRLAERKGVTVKRYTGDDPEIVEKIDRFYELTKETNARDGNSSHAKSYYLDLIKSSAERLVGGEDVPLVSLYIAESEGEEIASIMTLFSKTESIYLYGASSNHKRNLMPNHLLQWTAMKDAKFYGSQYYDMYGMPPEGKDENHPMHGLYMFKANFGGTNIHRTGSWDVPLKFIYRFYRKAENLRAFWYKKVVKKMKGR